MADPGKFNRSEVRDAKKVSIVIPCFNEEAVLPHLFSRLTCAAERWRVDFEVVCVDDGSVDSTACLLREQHERDARWCSLSFSRNFGHQTAVSAGLYHATGDAVIVIDADLQDPPEELHQFIAKWLEGYDVVYAVRQKRKESLPKRFCYWAFYRVLAKLIQFPIALDSGDFCIMDRKVVDVLNSMPERNRFVRGLRSWAGFRQVGVPYERHARAAGAAKYTFRKLFRLAFDGIFSFSTFPLRLASHLGFWISLISAGGILFTLTQRIFQKFFDKFGLAPVPGFATIVILILFLGGIQLLCLGIIGEYMGRIYDEAKHRPPWIVQSSCGIAPKTPLV